MDSACWQWTACKCKFGYGRILIGRHPYVSHRVSWLIMHGNECVSSFVLHKCDNPSCVNPEHLFAGTQSDNMMDREAKQRANHPSGDNHSSRRRNKSNRIRRVSPISKETNRPRGDAHYSRTNPEKLARGMRNANSKINPETSYEIHKMIASGVPALRIAARFNVSTTTIRNVTSKPHAYCGI